MSYNLLLENLKKDNLEILNNFYKNICLPIFKNDKELLFKSIQLFYDPVKYIDIKTNFNISSNDIKPLLFGYRFCLNELSNKNSQGIYYPLYFPYRFEDLSEKYYPGNDVPLNEVYNNIINHFTNFKDKGCYVCLCKKGFYHSVSSGFPDRKELNKKCPYCGEDIGAYERGFIQIKLVTVRRYNYYRIFKDDKEIEDLKNDRNKREKLREINYMTVEDYKKKYIYNRIRNKKGIFITNEKNFKNENKRVRNLSSVSYRLLNYILYSHLFFSRLITSNKDYDKFLPKKMSWVDTLNECWNFLTKELLIENIDSTENFINYLFVDLFPLLNKEKSIDQFENLLSLEDKLELKIKDFLQKYKNNNIDE